MGGLQGVSYPKVGDKLAGPRQGEGYILLLCFNLDNKFYLSIKCDGLMCNVRV